MKKILILGSVVSACPPKKQGGTERVAYVQAKYLAKNGIKIIFVGGGGTEKNFIEQLILDQEKEINKILKNIEFHEIGGGTAYGNQQDTLKLDPRYSEASRKLRIEILNLSKVQELMIGRKNEYDVVLNNLRGESFILPLSKMLNKKVIIVLHLNLFKELADFFKKYDPYLIPISNQQKKEFKDLNFLETIYNPVNNITFSYNPKPKNYALMISTIGYHKNQKEAILACLKAKIPLIIAGKIRDKDYFNQEVKPFIDGNKVKYYGELDFEKKIKLYQNAKVFLFPIIWQEPFGLVCIESLSCGTPVIAYPNGGPKEIVINEKNGFLVKNWQEMAKKIKQIEEIKRISCRKDCKERFSEKIIGEKYYRAILKLSRS